MMTQIKIVLDREDGVSYSVDHVAMRTMPQIGESLTVGPLLGLDSSLSLKIDSIAHPVSLGTTPMSNPVVTLRTHWSNSEVFEAAEARWETKVANDESWTNNLGDDDDGEMDDDGESYGDS